MANEQMRDVQSDKETSADAQLTKMQATLEEILQQLKQQNRMRYHRDFSYSKLIGAVAQLLVIGLLFWILIGLVDIGDVSGSAGTMLKILGAVLLQLVALTFFVLAYQDR